MVNRKAIRIKINDLLDICQNCTEKPVNTDNSHKHPICVKCQTYLELRSLGDALSVKEGKDMEPLNITIDEYVDFKNQGMLDRQIAVTKGLKKQQLANWKYGRREQISKALNQSPKKNESDWKNQYDKLSIHYQDLLKKLDKMESQYKLELDALKSEKEEHACASCSCSENKEDLENKIDLLRSQLYDKDYALENKQAEILKLDEDIARLARENLAMKELLRLWI